MITAALVRFRDAASTTRVMTVAIMVSMVAFLDGTVVNLALPAMARDIGGGMCTQKWVVDGYLLAVAARPTAESAAPVTSRGARSAGAGTRGSQYVKAKPTAIGMPDRM